MGRLPQANDTPFSEPDKQEDHLSPEHPGTDANVDPMEVYDEGLAAAAEVDLPGPPAVIGYQPPKKAKKTKKTKKTKRRK